MTQIAIIGAGIAGLTAGIYAKQSGFDVTIYESHTIPGGASTSWRRKGYLFEGGMHWLTGASPKTQLHKLWREVDAIDDATVFHTRDPFFCYESEGKRACLYRNIDRLYAHLCEISPVDKAEIKKLCSDVTKLARVQMPAMDLPKLKAKYPSKFPLSLLFGMLPAMPRMKYYQNLSSAEFAARFQSLQIRNLLINMIGEDFSASGLLFTIATLASGDGGYPEGGSLAMAKRMADRFQSLGGTIAYKTRVEKVSVENGAATGVVVAGETVPYDAVIVTQDTRSAIDSLFDAPLHEPWMEQMRNDTHPMLDVFIGLGVEADLSGLPEQIMFPASEPIRIGELTFESVAFNNYAGYEGYAPKGCTALTATLVGDSYDFWKRCRENGTYEQEKQKVAQALIHEIGLKYPETRSKIVVSDVATPLTYERYLHSYKGSWMSVTKKGQGNLQYPCKPECMQHLYFAGQRLTPPGGLPVALTTGRTAAQHLCLDTDTEFQGAI